MTHSRLTPWIIPSLCLILLGIGIVVPAYAATDLSGGFTSIQGDIPSSQFTDEAVVSSVVSQVAKTIIGVLGGLALVVFMYAGLQWLFAQGNEEKTGAAKKTMLWAALGILVIFLAYAALSYTIDKITTAALKTGTGSNPCTETALVCPEGQEPVVTVGDTCACMDAGGDGGDSDL